MPAGHGARAVAATREQDAEAFRRYALGQSYRRIGEEMGLPVSTAHDSVKRERKRRAEVREAETESALEEAVEGTRELLEEALRLVASDGASAVGQALKARKRLDDLLGVIIEQRVDVTSGGEPLRLDTAAVAAALGQLDADEGDA